MSRRTLAVILFATVAAGTAADTSRKKTPITPEQLRDEYALSGFLGVPLYEVATVDGTYRPYGGDGVRKGADEYLEVTAVNGRPLTKPVKFEEPFDLSARKIWRGENGRAYRLRVYESGYFRGRPKAALDETPNKSPWEFQEPTPGPSSISFDNGTGFETQLVVVRVLDRERQSAAPEDKPK